MSKSISNEWAWNTRARKSVKSPPLIQRIVVEEPLSGPSQYRVRDTESQKVYKKKRTIFHENQYVDSPGLSIHDLNQRIDRLEKIANKWRERGVILESRS